MYLKMDVFLSETKQKLKNQIEEECTKHLNSVFSAEFDKYVLKAIDDVKDITLYPTDRKYEYTNHKNQYIHFIHNTYDRDDVYTINIIYCDGRHHNYYLIDNYGYMHRASTNDATIKITNEHLYPLPVFLIEYIKNIKSGDDWPKPDFHWIRECSKFIYERTLLIKELNETIEKLAKENAELAKENAEYKSYMESVAPYEDLLGI